MTKFLGYSRTQFILGNENLIPDSGKIDQAQVALGEAMINFGTPMMKAVVPGVPRVAGVSGNLHVMTSVTITKSDGVDERFRGYQYNDQARDNKPVGWSSVGEFGYGPPFTSEEIAAAEGLLGSPTSGDYIQGAPAAVLGSGAYPPTLTNKSSSYFFDWFPFVPDSHTSVTGTLVVTATIHTSENFTYTSTTYATDYGNIIPPVSQDNINGFDVGQRFSNPTRYITPFMININGNTPDPNARAYLNATIAVSYTYGYESLAYVDSPKPYLFAQLYERQGDVAVMTKVSPLVPSSTVDGAGFGGVMDALAVNATTVAFLIKVSNPNGSEGLNLMTVNVTGDTLTFGAPLSLAQFSYTLVDPSYPPLNPGSLVFLDSYATMQLTAPGVITVVMPVREQNATTYVTTRTLASRRYSVIAGVVAPIDAAWSVYFGDIPNGRTVYGSAVGPNGMVTLETDYNGNFRLISLNGAAVSVLTASGYGSPVRLGKNSAGFTLSMYDYNTAGLIYATVSYGGVVTSTGVTSSGNSLLGTSFRGGSDKPWATRGHFQGQLPWGRAGYDSSVAGRRFYFGTLDPVARLLHPNLPAVSDLGQVFGFYGGSNDPSFAITPAGLGFSTIAHSIPQGVYELLIVLVQFGVKATAVPYLRLLQRDDGNGIARHARLSLSSGSPNQPSSEQSSRSPRLRQLPGSYL